MRPTTTSRVSVVALAATMATLARGVARALDLIDRVLLEPRRRARRRRRQLDAMLALSARQLADLGLDRADLQAVLWGGVPASQIGRGQPPAHGTAAVTASRRYPPRSSTEPEPHPMREAA